MRRVSQPRSSRRAPVITQHLARLDPLEPRLALAAVTWDSGGGDNLWSNPLNWSGDVLPGPGDDVDLTAPGPVVADLESIRIRSLRVRDDLTINAGAALRVDGTIQALGSFGSQLHELSIAGSLTVHNGTSPLGVTVLFRTSVQTGGLLSVGVPSGPRTRAQLSVLSAGFIRLQNIDPVGSLGNSAAATLELSNVDASNPLSSFIITSTGSIRVDDQAGPVTIVDVNSTGTITVLGDATLRLLASSVRGSTLRADSPNSRLQLHFADYDPFFNSNQVPPTINLTAVTFEGPGSTTVIGAANSTLRFGNTVVNSTLLIPSAAAVRVSGGRLTITGSLTQYGDDPQGDFLGSAQIAVGGTLTLAGPTRLVSVGLIIYNGGRVETTGPLMLLTGELDISAGGTLARTTPGLTRITGSLANRGAVDAELGRISILGHVTQLRATNASEFDLSGGTWIARNDAVLAWPQGTIITRLTGSATIELRGEESRIQGLTSLHTNYGTITLAGGRQPFLAGSNAPDALRNHGTIRKVGGGHAEIAIPVLQLKVPDEPAPRIEIHRGSLTLLGQNLTNNGILDIRAGTLTIDLGDLGTLTNRGTIDLGAGARLNIEGSLVNQSLVSTDITPAAFGRLAISGTLDPRAGDFRATFLSPSISPGFLQGQTRRIITSYTRLGGFSAFTTTGLPGNLDAISIYSDGRVAVRVIAG